MRAYSVDELTTLYTKQLTVMSSYPRELLGYDTLPRKLMVSSSCLLHFRDTMINGQ